MSVSMGVSHGAWPLLIAAGGAFAPCQLTSHHHLTGSDCPQVGPQLNWKWSLRLTCLESGLFLHSPLAGDGTFLNALVLEHPAADPQPDPDARHIRFDVRHSSSLSNIFIISRRICLYLYLLQQPHPMLAAHCRRERRDCSIPPQLDPSRAYAP